MSKVNTLRSEIFSASKFYDNHHSLLLKDAMLLHSMGYKVAWDFKTDYSEESMWLVEVSYITETQDVFGGRGGRERLFVVCEREEWKRISTALELIEDK